jgi:maltooligosyltrehalose trehalohydrolase
MHRFDIWAPSVKRLRVVVDGTTHDMVRDERGYWHAEVNEAKHGSSYGFYLDDDSMAYPDPRSQHQPEGVHKISRIVDHSQFIWKSDPKFSCVPLAEAVFYELHIGTFTPAGTCDGAIERLPYLKELGVTHVELMPFASYEGCYGWGYDGVAIFAPQEVYGGPDGLKRFVDACHEQGIAVVMDVVYNHFGPTGYYANKFAPYLREDGKHTEWGAVVNFHGEGGLEVRRFFCDNALMWLRDYRIDALRLDAIHALHDSTDPYFLSQLSSEVETLSRQTGRMLQLIAESSLNDSTIVTPREQGGRGIDAQWSDDFHHSLHTVLTGEHQGYYHGFGSIAQLAQSLHKIYVRTHNDFIKDDDPAARKPVGHLTADHFLGYIQDHDQVGNRAFGERIHQLAGMAAARVAAALVITGPSVPLIFQGEEFAASTPFLFFTDHEDEELRRAVFEGRKKEFREFAAHDNIPDPGDPQTFEKSKINWNELDNPRSEQAAMLNWYKSLLQLRRERSSLREGDLRKTHVTFDEKERWLSMQRGELQVVCNLSDGQRMVVVHPSSWIELSSEFNVTLVGDQLTLPPMSVAILETKVNG